MQTAAVSSSGCRWLEAATRDKVRADSSASILPTTRRRQKVHKKHKLCLSSILAWMMKSASDLKPVDTFTEFHMFASDATAEKIGSASAWLEAPREDRQLHGKRVSGGELLASAAAPQRCGFVQIRHRLHTERRFLLSIDGDHRACSKREFTEKFGKRAEEYWAAAIGEEVALSSWRMLWGTPINLLQFYKKYRKVLHDDWIQKWMLAPESIPDKSSRSATRPAC